MLVRSWNVFHGNTDPPERRAFLAEMVRLATSDRPDVLCLQELPVWSLSRLEGWSGMKCVADVAARPLLPAPLAKAVTDLNHGLLRSAVTGQANAILLAPPLRVLEHRVARLPSPEPRIAEAVRLDGDLVVANLHASGEHAVPGGAELAAAQELVDGLRGRVTILAGDFNSRPEPAGFSPPGPGIDHVFVRGAKATPLEVWPVERRTVEGRVLSDHAPVELRIDV
jgi:endonuclease/exonuclease/phosphatase family metal-dependent hydrolase